MCGMVGASRFGTARDAFYLMFQLLDVTLPHFVILGYTLGAHSTTTSDRSLIRNKAATCKT